MLKPTYTIHPLPPAIRLVTYIQLAVDARQGGGM